jgi:hypothetical protein
MILIVLLYPTGVLNYCFIDHNTFYSGMGFHGLLSLGNVGGNVVITNNLLVDAFSAGEDSTDVARTAEWGNIGETYPNGNNRMSWIFSAPNDVTAWDITNNYYAISEEGQAFFDAHTAEPITEGSPLSWHINTALGVDSTTAFVKIPDPGFTNVQDLMINVMNFYVDPAGGIKTKETGEWVRSEDDMDRRPLDFWMNDFDVSYSTSSVTYTGTELGYPAGNLNAYPDLLTQCLTGMPLAIEPEYGIITDHRPEQNYPNPFNPTTRISYSIPEHAVVSLVVYNSIEQEVTSLVSNNGVAPGQYDITWNGKDMSGHTVASGVYFYQLISKNSVKNMKMMLLKNLLC